MIYFVQNCNINQSEFLSFGVNFTRVDALLCSMASQVKFTSLLGWEASPPSLVALATFFSGEPIFTANIKTSRSSGEMQKASPGGELNFSCVGLACDRAGGIFLGVYSSPTASSGLPVDAGPVMTPVN